MTLIDGDKIVTAQLYDDEHEEFTEKKMSIIEYVNAYTTEGVTMADDVLDKISAEIETKYGQCDICEYFENYDYNENDISEYRPIGDIADILQIIDKYKAESEDKDADKKCTYKETGCGSCKRQLDCPIEADTAERTDT